MKTPALPTTVKPKAAKPKAVKPKAAKPKAAKADAANPKARAPKVADPQVDAPKVVKVSQARKLLEADILAAAKRLFAQRGFGGVSLDHIAREVGASKQNLLYYFPSKEELYRRVLHGVLDVWLSYMDALSQRPDDPEQALREYIAGKLRFSREHPDDSRVYANEVVSGAPIFSAEIAARVIPAVQADVAILNRWAERGLCRPLDGRHLMVLLWASTQVYADWASQISLVLGKPALEEADFAAAEALIVDMVLRTVLLGAGKT